MEENTVISNDKLNPDAAELKNGFVEPNGDQDTYQVFASVTFDELSNSNSMNEESVHDPDPLSNGTFSTSDTTDVHLLNVEPLELTQDSTNSTVVENDNEVNCAVNENSCENEDIAADENVCPNENGNEDTSDNVPENNENLDMAQPEETIEDVAVEQTEIILDSIVTKEEPEFMEYTQAEIATVIGGLTISSVFTDVGGDEPPIDNEVVDNVLSTSKSKKGLLNSIDRVSKKIIKSVGKQTRSFTSKEFLWFLIQLAPKCANNTNTDEQIQLQGIIDKIVSEESKKTIDGLLDRVKNFTSTEYAALFQKLGDRRTKDKPTECIKEFSQSVMWFKTHLAVEPEHLITKADLHNSYTSYCSIQGIKPLKSTEFMTLLRNIYPSVKERRRDSKGVKKYFYVGIKWRTALHPPKLPKFAEDQLHNNKLLSQYMSCHDCCAFYSSIILEKPAPHPGRPKLKIKFQSLQSKSETTPALQLAESSIVVDDPLDLLNVSRKEKFTEKAKEKVKTQVVEIVDLSQHDEAPVKLRQVAKKSVFSKRIKRVPSKYREYTPTIPNPSPSTSRFALSPRTYKVKHETGSPTDYSDKLNAIKQKLSRFVITKIENSSKFKVSCTCCQDVFYVTEHHGRDLISAQEKLCEIFKSSNYLPKLKDNYHPSVKRLYYRYDNVVLPENVVHDNIEPAVSINRFEVYDWYRNEISSLKRKLLESALSALNSNSRRSRYELKVPTNSSNLITHTPTQITPPHPPIYISAVREPPPQHKEIEPPKIAEVFIKSESKLTQGSKRPSSREPEVIEISAQKKPKPTYSAPLNTVYSRNRHMPYNRRKEADFIYFPAIDTSPNNLRLANLGTLYKCILCLMLFNTEQKLLDHEKAHTFCHKCRRALRNVEVMRLHLMKHCERNFRKRKPILKIHRVDSIPIMVKKYGETFEISKAYYKELKPKPKRKYREMIRPKVEPLPAAPVIEEIFLSDVKPNILHIPEIPPAPDQPDYNISLSMLLDVKPQKPVNSLLHNALNMSTTSMPVLSIAAPQAYVQQEPANTNVGSSRSGLLSEPPKLVPLPSTSNKKKNANTEPTPSPTGRAFKIRIKDLMELN